MTDTANLALPCIDAAQAQKHVTHNEALRILDTLVQLAVLDRDLNAPPGSPSEGQRWIVKSSPSPTGAWSSHGDQIAAWQDGGWQFSTPNVGWLVYVVDEGALIAWNATAWVSALSMLTTLQNILLLGIGTTADSINPFSAKLNNALWVAKTVAEGGDGNLHYKMSKESAAKTLSFLLQDNFSGRAEIGLTGDDDFHFKTSSDGATWVEALLLDGATGSAKLNSGFYLTGDISPATITADQNDYNPAGLSAASVLRLSSDAVRNVTGLAGGADGRLLVIANVGTSNIVLKNQSASSSAANRFLLNADLVLAANAAVTLIYDSTSTRWRLLVSASAIGALAAANNLADVASAVSARGNLDAAAFDGMAFNGMQVNGSLDVSQELGTTGATLASGAGKYIADCWEAQYVHGANTAVVTSAQVAAGSFPVALSGYAFGHQLKATTALTSPANGDYALHRQQIEGYRVARLAWGTAGAQPLAYAFQFYSTASGTAFVKVANSDKSRCFYQEFTVAAGWNWIASTIAGDTSGTWQKTTSAGMIFEIFSAGKAASPAAPGAWGSTNTTQTTNSTNLLGTNNNLTIVTGLFICSGTQLPAANDLPRLMRPFDVELVLCKRYWEKSYDYSVAPGTASAGGCIVKVLPSNTVGSNADYGSVSFMVAKRAAPTMTVYGFSGTSGTVSEPTAGSDLAAGSGTAVGISENGFGARNGSSGSITTANNEVLFQYRADARL